MRPGRIGITGNITLIQAITQAGGLGTGYGRTLYVLRTAANGLTEQIAVDIDDLMVNGNPDLNLPVARKRRDQRPHRQLDQHLRPRRSDASRQRAVPPLADADALAGPRRRLAARPTAHRKEVILKRMVGGVEKTFHYDFKKIIDGRQNDVVLMDGDRIIFQESFF